MHDCNAILQGRFNLFDNNKYHDLQRSKEMNEFIPEEDSKMKRNMPAKEFFPELKIYILRVCIILKVIIFPILIVCFDMLYSDLKVITQLLEYTYTIFNNQSMTMMNSTNNLFNQSNIDSGGAGISLLLVMARLSYLYLISMVGLLWTPWFSSLIASYKTSLKLLEEDVDMSTPPGKLASKNIYIYIYI